MLKSLPAWEKWSPPPRPQSHLSCLHPLSLYLPVIPRSPKYLNLVLASTTPRKDVSPVSPMISCCLNHRKHSAMSHKYVCVSCEIIGIFLYSFMKSCHPNPPISPPCSLSHPPPPCLSPLSSNQGLNAKHSKGFPLNSHSRLPSFWLVYAHPYQLLNIFGMTCLS